MGLFDRFPWVNTHELNLDWIIQKMKEWGADAAENVAAARTAAENAATNAAKAEPYAIRAEKAEANATISQIAAETAESKAGESRTVAETAATNAETSAQVANRYAADALNAATRAEAAANFPYTHNYNGCLYKTINNADTHTGNNKEFLIAPQDPNILYRVSGSRLNPYTGSAAYSYHYEKIYRIEMTYNQAANVFTGNYGAAIPGLRVINICPSGAYLIDSDRSYYYFQIPYCTGGTAATVGVTSADLWDDGNGGLTLYAGPIGVDASTGSCYCVIKVEYVEE